MGGIGRWCQEESKWLHTWKEISHCQGATPLACNAHFLSTICFESNDDDEMDAKADSMKITSVRSSPSLLIGAANPDIHAMINDAKDLVLYNLLIREKEVLQTYKDGLIFGPN